MSKDVSLGQYYPVNSVIHRLNPCLKLIYFIALLVMIFVADNFYGFIVIGAFLLFSILLSRVPIKSVLQSLKAILFIIVFTVILNLFFSPKTGKVVVEIWKIKLYSGSLKFSAFMCLRLVTLAIASAVLTLTTTPIELTDGIEALLKPLTYIKFPVHTLALIMSIALRFIPTLSEKTQTIMSAQKARGSSLDTGGFIKKVKALVPVLIPLLIGSFNIADQLGDAMDARCYGTGKRTKYKKLTFALRDLFAFILVVIVIVAIIILNKTLGGI